MFSQLVTLVNTTTLNILHGPLIRMSMIEMTWNIAGQEPNYLWLFYPLNSHLLPTLYNLISFNLLCKVFWNVGINPQLLPNYKFRLSDDSLRPIAKVKSGYKLTV